jgi:antitoxin component of MazEF toxin-antitoxin module
VGVNVTLMIHEYKVKRKLQEQSGSYMIALPKMWVESLGLKESQELTLIFNGKVTIIPPEARPDSSRQVESLVAAKGTPARR